MKRLALLLALAVGTALSVSGNARADLPFQFRQGTLTATTQALVFSAPLSGQGACSLAIVTNAATDRVDFAVSVDGTNYTPVSLADYAGGSPTTNATSGTFHGDCSAVKQFKVYLDSPTGSSSVAVVIAAGQSSPSGVSPAAVSGLTAGLNIVVGTGTTPTVATTNAPTFSGPIVGNAAAPLPSPLPTYGPSSSYGLAAITQDYNVVPFIQPGVLATETGYVSKSGGLAFYDINNPDTQVSGVLTAMGRLYFGIGTAGSGSETDASLVADAYGTHPDSPGVKMCFNVVPENEVPVEAMCMQQGHVEMNETAYDSGSHATPSTCTALATCGQISFTFPHAYVGLDGATPQVPICTGALIQDTTTAADMWVATPNTVSSTAVSFNYAPLTTISASKSVDLTFTCYIRSI